MKHFLVFALCLFTYAATAQITVTVRPVDTLLCYGDSIAFVADISGTVTTTVTYQWQKNLVDIPDAQDSLYAIPFVSGSYTGIYRCIVTMGSEIDTSNDARLTMHPKINVDTLYRYNPLGCPSECKGQFKTAISGGVPFSIYPPYIYDWNGGHSQDTIVFGLCRGKYTLTVTDSVGCHIDTGYYVDVLKSPKVTFDLFPNDTVYLTNPNIQVQFPDSMRVHMLNWTWDFGDSARIQNANPAYHTYDRTGKFNVKLSFTDVNGCDTTLIVELLVKVVELAIPNIFTPNGDGSYDKFKIKIKDEPDQEDYRQAYLSNEFMVFDRWGKKVFHHDNYKSEDWDGGNLSDGTYFYILKCHGQYSDDVFKGSVTILRGK